MALSNLDRLNKNEKRTSNDKEIAYNQKKKCWEVILFTNN